MTTRNPLLAACLLLASTPAAQDGLTPMQLMRLRQVTAVAASADGRHLAFTRLEPRLAGDRPGRARAHVWVVDAEGGEPRLVAGGDGNSGAAFDPAGHALTFVTKGEGAAHAEVWRVPLDGGAAQRVFESPRGVSAYRWRPDGGAIAFTLEDEAPAGRAEARELGFRQRIVDEDYQHVSLWLWERATGGLRRLTQGVTVHAFEWSPDGARLALAVARRNLVDDGYVFTRLFTLELAGGQLEPLVDNPGKLGHFAWSPDGATLAYVSAADRRDPHAGMLFTIARGEKEPRALLPHLRGMVHEVAWLDRGRLAFAASLGVESSVMQMAIDADRAESLVASQRIAFTSLLLLGGGRVATAASSPSHPPELLVGSAGGWERRTDSNAWLGEVALARQEVVRFDARDGTPIEGMLIHPLRPAGDRRSPLVIVAHGGPEAHYSDGWLTRYSEPGQVLAARGFAVWYPNYRASTGYGVEFSKLDHGDPMGGEFDDHLDAIAVLDARGLIDRARVGIVGGSYGGYTAAWAATKSTADFAAAVAFVPMADLRTHCYTTDIPHELRLVHYEEKWPHEQPGFFMDRSPLTWATRCRTPLLLLGGTADPRVHPSQPFMLFRAVQSSTDTPCRYVQYPDEGHGNRSNVYQYDYLLRSLQWLEHYLAAGDRRSLAPPPLDLDYGEWKGGG